MPQTDAEYLRPLVEQAETACQEAAVMRDEAEVAWRTTTGHDTVHWWAEYMSWDDHLRNREAEYREIARRYYAACCDCEECQS